MSEDLQWPGAVGPGSVVAGYRIESRLGAGGMAVVFRARDERLGRMVALKVMAPQYAQDRQFRERFIAESRAAAAVDDPHIIPIYEADEADGLLFIAMRLVLGSDLRGIIRQEGAMPPARVLELLSPVASALDSAHNARLVHRDVKPENILVHQRPGHPDYVYLSDFGLSKSAATGAVSLTGTGQYLGTPNYSSPEQCRGKPVDGQTDQYALACVAYQMFTGRVPFERDDGLAILLAHVDEPPPPLTGRRPELPAAADRVMATALAKSPGDRYPACRDFIHALRGALGPVPYRHVLAPESARPTRHHRAGQPTVARPALPPGSPILCGVPLGDARLEIYALRDGRIYATEAFSPAWAEVSFPAQLGPVTAITAAGMAGSGDAKTLLAVAGGALHMRMEDGTWIAVPGPADSHERGVQYAEIARTELHGQQGLTGAALDTDGQAWTWSGPSWSWNWQKAPASGAGPFSVITVCYLGETPTVFAVADGRVYRTVFGERSRPVWRDMEAPGLRIVDVACWSYGDFIELYTLDSDGQIRFAQHTRSWAGRSKWHSWQGIDAPPGDVRAITAAAQRNFGIHTGGSYPLLAVTADRTIYQARYVSRVRGSNWLAWSQLPPL